MPGAYAGRPGPPRRCAGYRTQSRVLTPFRTQRGATILEEMLLTLSIIGAVLLLVMGVHAYAAWTIRDIDTNDER